MDLSDGLRTSLLRVEYELIRKCAKETDGDVNPYIGDAFFKVNYHNGGNNLAIGAYFSDDYLNYREDNAFIVNWSNKIIYLKWDHAFSDKCQFKTDIYYDNFFSGQEEDNYTDENMTSKLRIHSNFNEYTLRSQLIFALKNISYNIGFQETAQELVPVTEKYLSLTQKSSRYNESPTSNTLSAFAEGKLSLPHTEVSLGIRCNDYSSQSFHTLLPDIHFNFIRHLTSTLRWIASFDKLSQYNHIIEGLPVGWSLDLSVPSDATFKPERAWQGYSGLMYDKNGLTFSLGGYYKRMNNLVSYSNPADVFYKDLNWREETITGKGRSYGMELRAEKRGNSFNGSLSYTWSKTFRQFDAINEGKEFPFKFDRRHILNATAQICTHRTRNHEQWFNLTLNACSGHRMTIAQGSYEGTLPPYWDQRDQSGLEVSDKEDENAWSRQLMGAESGYKLPIYFRTDIGYEFRSYGKKTEKSLTIGIYNVFNRKNPYLIFYEDDRWKQLSILPIVPSIDWSIKF